MDQLSYRRHRFPPPIATAAVEYRTESPVHWRAVGSTDFWKE
jgi:hypothetical protein